MSRAGGAARVATSYNEWALREEMMDGIMGPVCEKARFDLWTETLKVGREYRRRAAAWFEKKRAGTSLEPDEDEGDVVQGIEQLMKHWKRDYATFKRWEDTYHCCLTLHLCTKFLACDRKKDPKRPSKDDRFNGIYEGNYQLRRDWVAFLSRIVAYVESMYLSTDTDKLYLNAERLTQMAHVYRASEWIGYAWDAIKGHIDAAQDKISKEPAPTAWQKMRQWVPGRGAGLEDGDDVGAMLARLRELSV
jgi:hypothetical protein